MRNKLEPKVSQKVIFRRLLGAGGVALGLASLLLFFNISSTEICGNGIDDDSDGMIDEAGCSCNSGFPVADSNIQRYAIAQSNNSVGNATNALGAPDGSSAEIYSGTSVIALTLDTMVAAGETYTVHWGARRSSSTAYMMISESSNGTDYYYNTTISTSSTSISSVDIIAGVNTRYIRFDKETFSTLSGTTVSNGVASNNIEDYNLDAVVISFDTTYTCASDIDGDGVSDVDDLDDDNDGIPDLIELIGYDINNCSAGTMHFENEQLESGTALSQGAVYRYSDILTGIDALIEIDTLVNATLDDMDRENRGEDGAIQPWIRVSNVDSGYVDLSIRFVKANTSTDTALNFIGGAILDIDGSREGILMNDLDFVGLESNTELNYISGDTFDLFKSTGNDYVGINPSITSVMAYFNKRNTSTIHHRSIIYSPTGTTNRESSLYFDPCIITSFTTFVSAAENDIDSDGDGVPDYQDLDSDNDGIYDAEESGSGAAHSSGRLSGTINANGLAASVDTDADGVIDYFIHDSDGDSNLDFVEFDSDGDGCADAVEAGFDDGNNDGRLDGAGYSSSGLVTGFSSGYASPGSSYTNSSDFSACGGVLPVEWLAFVVSMEDGDADIYWATSKETNSDYYQIERSFDQVIFQSIGKVEAAGNSDIVSEYQFYDKGLGLQEQSSIFYRIKQTDIDGRVDYSNVYQLQLSGKEVSVYGRLTVFPNPAYENINVSIEGRANDQIEVYIFSAEGQQMMVKRGSTGTFNVNIQDWPDGVYIVQVKGLSQPASAKFIKASR